MTQDPSQSSRRTVLVAGAALAAAAATFGSRPPPGRTAPPAAAPAGLAAGGGSSKIFQVTDTATGQGAGHRQRPDLGVQGHPVRCAHRRQEPPDAAAEAPAWKGRARMLRLRLGLPADPGRPPRRVRPVHPLGSPGGRRWARICLSLNVVDPQHRPLGQAGRDGVVPRRRLRYRLRQRARLRRQEPGLLRRRGGGDREPPAGQLRLHQPDRRGRAGGLQIRRRLRGHGHGRRPAVGSRQYRGLRRRSELRDDFRPVGRWGQDLHRPGHAHRPRASSSTAPPCSPARRCGWRRRRPARPRRRSS